MIRRGIRICFRMNPTEFEAWKPLLTYRYGLNWSEAIRMALSELRKKQIAESAPPPVIPAEPAKPAAPKKQARNTKLSSARPAAKKRKAG